MCRLPPYEHALELGWAYGETSTVVASGRQSPARKNVEFYSGHHKTLVDVKVAPRYRTSGLVDGPRWAGVFSNLGWWTKIKLMIAFLFG
jgi:hypothetical protein